VRREIIVVTALTAIAQAAGFLKLWFTARLFGISAELDGYFLALVLPTLISGVVSGMLQTGLFPVRAKLAAAADTRTVERFERSVLVGLLVLGGAIAVVVIAAAPHAFALLAQDVPATVREAAAFVLPYAAALIFLNAIGAGLGYLLAMRHRYSVAVAAPIANALLGAGLLAVWPEGGLFNLALGTALGLALQVGICAIALERTGFRLFGPLLERGQALPEWREMARLSAWILPGLAFSNLTVSLSPALAASFGEGAVSAFGYAWRLHAAALQLLVMAASPVVLARFADLVARQEHEMIARLLRKAAWLSLGAGVCVTLFVSLLGAPLLELLFAGRFDAAAANRVSVHWFWLAIGLGPAMLGNVMAKLWQARRQPALLSTLAGTGFGIFLTAFLLLGSKMHESAIALGMTLSACLVTGAGWWLWSRIARGNAKGLAMAIGTGETR
jgi:peptidoglycan biosynthesis protein MviN/MurJ (putative lipid II flippase)